VNPELELGRVGLFAFDPTLPKLTRWRDF